ncbi:FYVE-domain-containing protein [Rhizopogon vinicolor AM-OR11-026]|uniref:RING-type E3 ubiquitin transferase n=1 Tax=Rhizopogon vinicolor AM-OR11-026 TaxID=1314800 RepID=A0A1B7NG92_9AGAM|nr:FYVE-domain-containing protein [Rhizopogon vinicolor AM-OR11-026]
MRLIKYSLTPSNALSVNAASKGHLPIVLYLLTKQGADPLVRNNWGETAYDAAAAVFEVWICEVLQKAEAEQWRRTTAMYNPLTVHTTVPLILYENQHLDTRLKTLAGSGGKPKFSGSGLGRRGRRAPFELKLPYSSDGLDTNVVAAWRSDVQLPLIEDPWILPATTSNDRPSLEGIERSHFWLSDWTLDVTHPGVDAEAGWQYALDFSAPEEAWSAEPPPQLERLLSGSGLMTGLGVSARSHSRTSSSSSATSVPASRAQTWVRRRRWVRVMRRRLDIPPLPFQGPDGVMYLPALDGSLIPFIGHEQSDFGEGEGQELGTMTSTRLSSAQDYVSRARYLVGTQRDAYANGEMLSAVEARRAIAKLERATTELRQGILSDDDTERKTQAEVLLNAYSRELERRRLSAGAQGLLILGLNDDYMEDDDDDDDEFHYPGYTPPGTSVRSISTEYLSRSSSYRAPTDLTSHLSQAPDFRVPTHEAPQKVLTPRWTAPTPHQVHARWERDDAVSNCNDCRRRFGFLLRRHCRKCGRIFCDRCSSYRVLLDPSDIVRDPVFPESAASTSSQRVCQGCHDEINASVPARFSGSTSSAMERIVIDQRRLMAPGTLHRQESSSQLSDLAECPVCSTSLADLGLPAEQEAHVKSCLEGGAGTTPEAAKYLVYKLPAESALLGVECVICLEEFAKGSLVARLSCFCSFHNACLSSWLQRGRSCPVHAR